MQYSDVMQSLTQKDGLWLAEVSEDWLQGRSVFGGLQVALTIKAMEHELTNLMPLRTIQASFLAPVSAGSLSIQVKPIRQGNNTRHMEARIVDGEETLCLIIGIFGNPRESVVSVTPEAPPLPDKKPFPFPYIPNMTPAFTQHFTVNWRQGFLPFSGREQNTIQVDIKLETNGNADASYIAALADFMPPVALSYLKQPAPASSLTWMLEFFCEQPEATDQPWRIAAQMDAAAHGYTSQSMLIIGPSGKPVALSRQSMVVFG